MIKMKVGFFKTRSFLWNQLKTYEISVIQKIMKDSRIQLIYGGIPHKAILGENPLDKDKI